MASRLVARYITDFLGKDWVEMGGSQVYETQDLGWGVQELLKCPGCCREALTGWRPLHCVRTARRPKTGQAHFMNSSGCCK